MSDTRACRKCGKHIPCWIKIGEKYRNLQNRKFCLDCSPYKKYNNKPDDPSRPNKTRIYSQFSKERKHVAMAGQYRRALERKKYLIKLGGGKCKECGYDKCLDAIVFHHKINDTKNFGLTLANLWCKSMKIILEEFNKCEILCSNCHIELHRKINDENPNSMRHFLLKKTN